MRWSVSSNNGIHQNQTISRVRLGGLRSPTPSMIYFSMINSKSTNGNSANSNREIQHQHCERMEWFGLVACFFFLSGASSGAAFGEILGKLDRYCTAQFQNQEKQIPQGEHLRSGRGLITCSVSTEPLGPSLLPAHDVRQNRATAILYESFLSED